MEEITIALRDAKDIVTSLSLKAEELRDSMSLVSTSCGESFCIIGLTTVPVAGIFELGGA